MTNREIAAVLSQVADLLEFLDANPFRVRAYRNGARKIGDLSEPLSGLVDDPERKLTDLEGVGKDLAEKIETLLATGTLPMLDELASQVPATVLDLMRIPGMGPKKAAVLYNELGIATLDQLRTACESGQVRCLKGFGEKTEQKILGNIDLVEQALARIRWIDADEIVAMLSEHMAAADGIRQMQWAGSYRRGCETVGDLDLLVEADDAEAVMDHLGDYPRVVDTLARGKNENVGPHGQRAGRPPRGAGRVVWCGPSILYRVEGSQCGRASRCATRLGLKVNEWGVFRTGDYDTDEDSGENFDEKQEEYLAGRTEEEVYAALGLPCFPPELREDREEFAWAEAGELPELVRLEDIRGDLHMHTTESDGKATLEEMVAEARRRGLEYIAITDHSQRVSMAGGLNPERLLAQWKEIDRINGQYDDIEVLKGIECDILERGGMDLPDEVLVQADWVIASVHYGQQQPEQQITERILGALENPHVDIIAHPTGRLIGRRDPYAVDMEQVMDAAAQHGKMLELNANPARLDLNDIHCAASARRGIPIVISTDAHSTQGMEVMRHGVQQARRGGLTAANVANTLPWGGVSAAPGWIVAPR